MPDHRNQSAIPRVLHWLWLGPDDVPDIFRHYTDSWRRHHPAWEMRLWRDETLPALSCQAECEAAKFKTRYDIVRLELLRQFGGVIVDMDVEAIRPLDLLLQGVTAFVGEIEGGHIGNQVLGAVPHHPFFEYAIAQLKATATAESLSARAAGKAFLKHILRERPDGVAIFPPDTFHYHPSFDPPKHPEDFPGVFAVHHELASYRAPPEAGVLELLAQRVVKEAEALAAGGGIADAAQARGRLDKAVRRLQRGIRYHAQGYNAVLRRAEAVRQQALVQLEQAHRRLADLERRDYPPRSD